MANHPLQDFVERHENLFVLTGAGCSTNSGIPDYRDSQGNNQERTTWVDCAYWTDRTGISPYLTKGKQVFVEGTPEVRTFTRNDGTAGASLSLRVRDVQLLGGRGENAGVSAMTTAESYSPAKTPIPNAADVNEPIDDLPF